LRVTQKALHQSVQKLLVSDCIVKIRETTGKNYPQASIVSVRADRTDDEGRRDGHKFSLCRAAVAAAADKMLSHQP